MTNSYLIIHNYNSQLTAVDKLNLNFQDRELRLHKALSFCVRRLSETVILIIFSLIANYRKLYLQQK